MSSNVDALNYTIEWCSYCFDTINTTPILSVIWSLLHVPCGASRPCMPNELKLLWHLDHVFEAEAAGGLRILICPLS